ncbi:hypothetical protein LguiA_003485 [Lonicera macranthoides]
MRMRWLNKCVNGTYICLIPKRANSCKLKDFRPVSLVTSLYKILAKVFSLRLREVLEETISLCQGVFVKGRQILDLVFVTNEVVEEYRTKKKEGVVFKIFFLSETKLILIGKIRYMPRGRKWMRNPPPSTLENKNKIETILSSQAQNRQKALLQIKTYPMPKNKH